ncbi:MAG: hypothetical protein IKA88_02375, partial [Clostridia bacterium]|nr:hypothetical protein [Clostridia bacterium]
MYINQEFNLLKNNQIRFSSPKLDLLIRELDDFYVLFNKNYKKYTKNYIETMTNIMNQFFIKNLISNVYGGTLY